MSSPDTDEGVIILNPVSGDGEHAEAVHHRATLQGHAVRETEGEGDAIEFAREAAEDGASLVVAAGGDGTVKEVLEGLDEAAAFEQVTFGVVPAGTGNNFAENIGISTIDEGFAALERGERRRIDLGRANDEVFVNSCVGGLTADASAETSHQLKHRYGVLAYVITTLQTAAAFDGIHLSMRTAADEAAPAWTGEAACVFVGNGRRFPTRGRTQANMEDGQFDVTVVEEQPTVDLVEETLGQWLFDTGGQHVTQLHASNLEIRGLDEVPVNFSLDGEMVQCHSLTLAVEPDTVRLPVGEAYEPEPGD
jgi:YegS/Rv2252/BmrU family lipid kinase